jgi:LPS-assembly lipoprotein
MLRRVLLLSALALVLTGCGFHLRSSQNFAFDTIAVSPAAGGPIAIAMTRVLGERVRPLTATSEASAPQVVLEILQENREKTVVGVNASGQVREFQLRIRVKFRLRTLTGRELIVPTDIVQQRDFSYSETAALAKEAEEVLLYRDMQADIVQQLLRRLAAVKVGDGAV